MTTIQKNILQWIFDISIISLLIIGGAFNDFFTLIAVFFACVYILFSKPQRIIELGIIIAPFAGIMYFANSFSLFNVILLISLIGLIKNNANHIPKSLFLYALGLILVGVFSLIFSGFSIFADFVTFFIEMLLIAMVILFKGDFHFKSICSKFAIGLIISSLCYYFVDYLPGIQNFISNAQYRIPGTIEKIIRFSGLVGNPNHYSFALNLIIGSLLAMVITKKGIILDYFCIIICVFFGIYSLSNSFFLCLIFTFLVIGLYLLFHQPKKLIIASIIFAVGIIILINFFGTRYIEIILNRLSLNSGSFDLNEYTTDRIDHYQLYMNTIFFNPQILLFGQGIFTDIDGVRSHNFILENLYYYGVFGSIVTWGGLIQMYKSKRTNKGALRFFGFAIFMFRGLALNLMTSALFPYYVILCFLMLDVDFKFQRNKKITINGVNR